MELGLPLVFILELFQLLEATLRSLPCGPCQRPSLTCSLSAQFLLSANLTRSGPSRYFSFDELNPLTTHWRSNIPLFTGSTHSVVKDLEVWHAAVCVCVRAKSLRSCQTLCDSVACSLPGSSVHRILQTRTREWVAMPSSRGSSRLRDWTCESCLLHRQVDSLSLVPPGLWGHKESSMTEGLNNKTYPKENIPQHAYTRGRNRGGSLRILPTMEICQDMSMELCKRNEIQEKNLLSHWSPLLLEPLSQRRAWKGSSWEEVIHIP